MRTSEYQYTNEKLKTLLMQVSNLGYVEIQDASHNGIMSKFALFVNCGWLE